MAAALLASQASLAAPIYWANPGTGNWAAGTNWDTGSPPLATDDAYIENGGTAEVTTPGAAAHYLYLSYAAGTSGSLSVQTGGTLSNDTGYLGYSSGGNGTATVDGAGSTWANGWGLHVGFSATGTLTVQNGGSVSDVDGYLGYYGVGNGTATVDGAGSTWANSASLNVGYIGTGTLNVTNGGSVSNTTGYLGCNTGSAGTATVDGGGSLWSSSGSLYVGGWDTAAGGTGEVTVSNGGEVRVGGTLKVWGTGAVNLNAGGLVVADVAELVPGSAFNTQAGSTLRINTLSGFGAHPSFPGALQFGHGGGGGYTLGAGQSLETGEDLTVGYDATGVFTQTGGANTVGGDLVLASEAGSAGTYYYQGGTLSLGGGIRGGAGTSAFIVGGGSGFPVLYYDGALSLVNLSIFGIENQGAVEVIGGATLPADQLTVGAGGLLGIDRGTVALTTALDNDGEVQLGNAISARIQAPLVNNRGLLSGSGRIIGDLHNDGGQLLLGADTLIATGTLTNDNGGLVMGNGLLRADGGLTNTSTMAFSGVTNVIGDVDNQAAGLIIVSGVGPTTFFDDLTNNGEIRVSAGTSAVYFGSVDGSGLFSGAGTNYFEGDLKPGSSPGILAFEGDVVFAATNHLIMELAGFAAGTGYDQVNILGDVTLGGELEVLVDRALRDLMQGTETFTLVSASVVFGEFANVAPGGRLQSADLFSEFTVYYGPTSPFNPNWVVLSDFAAIPEPATLTLLALGGLGLLARRRRKS